jgi:hypothetical protein
MTTKANKILNLINDNCPRNLEIIEKILATKTELDTKTELFIYDIIYSYYAAPITNRVLPVSDIIIGFVANKPTTFIFSIGDDIHLTNRISKKIALTKSLNTGEFQLALNDNVYPAISSPISTRCSISNLSGSGFIIYANLGLKEREILSQSDFSLGTYRIHNRELITNTLS